MGWQDGTPIAPKAPTPVAATPAWMQGAPVEPSPYAQALGGAQTIGATPWYSQGVGGLVGMSGRGPSVMDALSTLPTIGGAAGGMLGGAGGTVFGVGVGGVPGAVGGAALGGGAGEALRQHIQRGIGATAPETSAEAAKAIGTEAVVQGGAELGGVALRRGAKALGTGMIENAVRPTASLQREFPNVMETIIKEKLPVGAAPFGTVKGSERAAKRLTEESTAVRALLQKATAGGKNFETSKLAEPVLKLLDDIADQPLAASDMARLDKMLTEFTNKKGPLSPLDVQKLKQSAQAIAKPIYKAQRMGLPVSADQSLLARFNGSIATGAKQAMETIPGVAEGEAKKRALIGAERALSAAEKRRLSLMAESIPGFAGIVSGMIGGQGGIDEGLEKAAGTYAVLRLGMSPRALSRGALVLTSNQAQALIRQFPRLGLAALTVGYDDTNQPKYGQ